MNRSCTFPNLPHNCEHLNLDARDIYVCEALGRDLAIYLYDGNTVFRPKDCPHQNQYNPDYIEHPRYILIERLKEISDDPPVLTLERECSLEEGEAVCILAGAWTMGTCWKFNLSDALPNGAIMQRLFDRWNRFNVAQER